MRGEVRWSCNWPWFKPNSTGGKKCNFLFMFSVFINKLLLITFSKQINCHSLIWSHTTQRFHSNASKGQYYLTCWHANSKLLSKKCNEKMQSYCRSQGRSGCFGSSSSSHGVKAHIQHSRHQYPADSGRNEAAVFRGCVRLRRWVGTTWANSHEKFTFALASIDPKLGQWVLGNLRAMQFH